MSVCLSVTLVSHTKTAAPIEMPFGLMTPVDPLNHVLDGGPDPPMGRDNFEGEKWCPIVKYRDTPRSSVQKRLNRSRCHLGCGHGLTHGITNYMGSKSSNGKGQFWMKGTPMVNIGTFCRELCKSR